MRRRLTVVLAALAVAAGALGLAAPAGGQGFAPREGLAEALHVDVTYTPTNTHVTFGPEPRVQIGPEPGTRMKGELNFNLPAGADAFELAEMEVLTDGNFSNRLESAAWLEDFDLIGFRGDKILTECEARADAATGTTTLTNVTAGPGNPLPDNPAPNTVIEFVPNLFTVHLNEQQLKTGAGGHRIEITALRVVFNAGDYRGSFSFGHIVCGFGGGGALAETPGEAPPEPAAVALEPTFTG